MTNAELQIKIKERLNKLASLDYDNFECWQIVEAFNKAQLEWFRRQLGGLNPQKQGDGSSKMNYDDTQKFIKTISLNGTNFADSFVSDPQPTDYLYYGSLRATAQSDCCPERNIIIYMIDKADLSITLRDANKKPSFEWGETIAIMSGDKFTIYTDQTFNLTSVDLSYYRKPNPVSFAGCVDISTGAITVDSPCEFKDDVAEIIVDNAVAILAADIESFNQYSRATNAVQSNT